MSFKSLLTSSLLVLVLWGENANAGPFSQMAGKPYFRWGTYVVGVALFTQLMTTPIDQLRVDKKIYGYLQLRSEHIRLNRAVLKIDEVLKKESDSMLLLVSDIDETMKYQGGGEQQAERHAQLNDFFGGLRRRNKFMLIYNTHRSSPISDLDFFVKDPKAESYQHLLVEAYLNTLPRPDVLIHKGGRDVCYLTDAVEYMRSRPNEASVLSGTIYEKHLSGFAFSDYWDYNFITPYVRNSPEGKWSHWHNDWRVGGSEAVYTFQPSSVGEVIPYIAQSFRDVTVTFELDNNLPVRLADPTENLSPEQIKRHQKFYQTRAEYYAFQKSNYGCYHTRPNCLDGCQTTESLRDGENFVLFYDRYFNKGAALSRVISSLSENHHFKGKKIYLITAGDSVFDVSMLSPTLRYPFLDQGEEDVRLKPLPANINFLKGILTQASTSRDKEQVDVLISDFPEFKRHIVKCPASDVLSFIETLADVLVHEIDSQADSEQQNKQL